MKKAQFEIGYKATQEGLFGGSFTKKVIARTDRTVTFRETWISEDSGKLCHADETKDVELDEINGNLVERVVLWEYCGQKGYLYCLNDDELHDLRYGKQEEKEETEPDMSKRYAVCYKTDAGKSKFVATFDTLEEADSFMAANWSSWLDEDGELYDTKVVDLKNIYGMENVKIVGQEGRGHYNYRTGRTTYKYFDVIADTKRFGKNEIMCQGTWKQCLDYLEENGIDYVEECLKRNRQQDIQVGVRMYRITEETETYLRLRSRDGDDVKLEKNDWTPTAPDTFRIPATAITWWTCRVLHLGSGQTTFESGHPYNSGYSKKYYSLKMMTARAW